MILDILTTFNDARKNGDDCLFNGYLEDYLHLLDNHEEHLQVLFQQVLQQYPNARVCVGLRFAINKEVVSNQIIGYKDAFKLEGKALVCPFLVYLNQDDEERLFLLTRNKRASYLFAKSLYFCLTEPTSIFEAYKNNIVTMDSKDIEKTMQIFNEAFTKPAGVLQKKVDQDKYTSYESLKADAMSIAAEVKDNAFEMIRPLEDKTPMIRESVGAWFLLKKLVYVQYMVNKAILQSRYQGDVKKQRAQARENSKAIPFIAYSELWRCAGDNLPTDKETTEE
ncbi:hypothetical protein [Anaerorhabdus furcosa]|uniref:Uncharacterized protein n=1 Tax=Anaerorhabdus furcosa TaxID=118967 RepID=A0A1T4MQS0_9FIRM|nr:hypothetical protein [Anaerorhabdus furcosa]SJZ69460.1 hypothetical protein SAMN02745191_1368 [Anaerorhabdus furcosa]